VAKYYIRKLMAPVWSWRKNKMLNMESKTFGSYPYPSGNDLGLPPRKIEK